MVIHCSYASYNSSGYLLSWLPLCTYHFIIPQFVHDARLLRSPHVTKVFNGLSRMPLSTMEENNVHISLILVKTQNPHPV